jgi:hypothetical protein
LNIFNVVIRVHKGVNDRSFVVGMVSFFAIYVLLPLSFYLLSLHHFDYSNTHPVLHEENSLFLMKDILLSG